MITVFEIAVLCSTCIFEPFFFSFIIIVRFIAAPEITTAKGKNNANAILNFNTKDLKKAGVRKFAYVSY